MASNFIVFMSGYTGTGKSTIAKKISKIKNTDLYHSAVVRKGLGLTPKNKEEADKFFDYRNGLRQKVDRKVYGTLAEKAKESIKRNKNVILDAGYFFQWQRQLVYSVAEKFEVDLFSITAVCRNDEEIKKRLELRARNYEKSPLNETPSWNTYIATKLITEPVEKDKYIEKVNLSIYEFNTLNQKLLIKKELKNRNSEKIKQILTGKNV